ncbi:MAG TPA: nitroreductase/quinone reductase family protein [Dehalococcoidia bacterium]
MRKAIVIALSIVSVVAAAFLLPPKSWFYQKRRPTRLGKAVNRVWSWAATVGLTPSSWPGEPRGRTVTLEVRGRVSGQPRSNAVTWVEQDGQRYLVSMLGKRVEWVKNVRAAEGQAVIRHGWREKVILEEMPVERRAPILKAYLKRTALSTRSHIGLDPEAPLAAFQRVAPLHPVFHICRIDRGTRKATMR